MTSVLVFGSINKDTIVSIARAPRLGETLLGRSVMTAPGGKGANQAVAAARLGANVRMFGAVGIDADGDMMLATLSHEGVDVSCVARVRTETGSAILTVTDDGENSIIVIPGANRQVGAGQIEQLGSSVRPGDIVVAQLEVPLDEVVAALETAQNRNAHTILNAAPAQDIARLLPLVDILVVNESEAALLWGAPVDSVDDARLAAAHCVNDYAVVAVITLGSSGLVIADANSIDHVPAHAVKAVDSTGAGDTFVGALAAFLAEGMSLRDAAGLASRAGAVACTALGAQASMPMRASLDTTQVPA
ncbi:ribokinase [Pseudarthrobacter sp. H2]|uniref:ribokinase n=1 Tax=Pseudarthrobacter sp. H2 TaxID=3418415 RepID=UPI003CF0BBCC